MTRVAVVKPDHLGDLILSGPAIRAAQRRFRDIALFVSNSTDPLAKYLFPDLELQPINFPHLSRSGTLATNLDAAASVLNGFDLVLWLRDDPFIHQFSKQIAVPQDFASGGHLVHETAVQKTMMLRHVDNYSRTALFSNAPIDWPKDIRIVGLCIGSGFPTNRWPNVFWLELATKLSDAGLILFVIAGPGERNDAALLARSLQAKIKRVIVGGSDFSRFLDELETVDLVIATDGGSAHICSMRKPVLSIFGSSPWRRYAPFGRHNVVLTRDLSCSPCCNFSMEEVNGCMTRECIIGVEPDVVASILFDDPRHKRPGLIVQRGTSHLFDGSET